MLSSPERNLASSFLRDTRNNELSHRDALAAAQLEHERVRQAAIRVYELHELQEEHKRILAEERKEEERLKAEAAIVAEEKRLRELKAKTVPKLPPEPAPQPASPAKQEPAKTNGATPAKESKQPEVSTTPATEVKKPAQPPAPATGLFASKQPGSPFGTTQPSAQNPFQKPNGVVTQAANAPATVATAPQPVPKPAVQPVPAKPAASVDRYSQIHQELKKLRRDLQAQSKVAGSPMKGKLGAARREIRVAIGQLTGGKGANTQPVSCQHPTTLNQTLTEDRSIKSQVRSRRLWKVVFPVLLSMSVPLWWIRESLWRAP